VWGWVGCTSRVSHHLKIPSPGRTVDSDDELHFFIHFIHPFHPSSPCQLSRSRSSRLIRHASPLRGTLPEPLVSLLVFLPFVRGSASRLTGQYCSLGDSRAGQVTNSTYTHTLALFSHQSTNKKFGTQIGFPAKPEILPFGFLLLHLTLNWVGEFGGDGIGDSMSLRASEFSAVKFGASRRIRRLRRWRRRRSVFLDLNSFGFFWVFLGFFGFDWD